MNDEVPEHIRNMTRRDVIAAVRSGVMTARALDGTPFMFPASDRVPRKGQPALTKKPVKEPRKSTALHRTIKERTYAAQDSRCYYCNQPQLFVDWTLDHKLPVSRGGKHGDNIVGACYECNNRKDCLTVEEFLEVRHSDRLRKLKITATQVALTATKGT